jgi:hypothetical protein
MILLGKLMLGVVGTAVAGVGLLCSEGLIEVNVVEKQPEAHHIYVLAPALLIPMGLHFVPKQKLGHASAELQPWMPTIRAALDGLRDGQDVTLVEVKQEGQHVLVASRGGDIIVDVTDKDDTVHVSAPIRAISSTVEQLAAAGEENASN